MPMSISPSILVPIPPSLFFSLFNAHGLQLYNRAKISIYLSYCRPFVLPKPIFSFEVMLNHSSFLPSFLRSFLVSVSFSHPPKTLHCICVIVVSYIHQTCTNTFTLLHSTTTSKRKKKIGTNQNAPNHISFFSLSLFLVYEMKMKKKMLAQGSRPLSNVEQLLPS